MTGLPAPKLRHIYRLDAAVDIPQDRRDVRSEHRNPHSGGQPQPGAQETAGRRATAHGVPARPRTSIGTGVTGPSLRSRRPTIG
jgi:hypothetical protein